jgi:hypothetical protein
MKFDAFKRFIENKFEMPDNMISLLVGFLEQGNGKLSKRARSNEFKELTEDEIGIIEEQFASIFSEN